MMYQKDKSGEMLFVSCLICNETKTSRMIGSNLPRFLNQHINGECGKRFEEVKHMFTSEMPAINSLRMNTVSVPVVKDTESVPVVKDTESVLENKDTTLSTELMSKLAEYYGELDEGESLPSLEDLVDYVLDAAVRARNTVQIAITGKDRIIAGLRKEIEEAENQMDLLRGTVKDLKSKLEWG